MPFRQPGSCLLAEAIGGDLYHCVVGPWQLQFARLFRFVGSVDNYALESGAVHSHLPTDIDGAASMSRIVPK